jgi:hypothetical protein
MKQSLVDQVFSTIRGVCSEGEEVLLIRGLRMGCVVDGKVDDSLEDVPEGGAFSEVLVTANGERYGEALSGARRRKLKVIVCAKEKRSKHVDIPIGIGYVQSEELRDQTILEEGPAKRIAFRIRLSETFPARKILEAHKAHPGFRNGHFLRREFYKRAALEPCQEIGCIVKCRVGPYTDPL